MSSENLLSFTELDLDDDGPIPKKVAPPIPGKLSIDSIFSVDTLDGAISTNHASETGHNNSNPSSPTTFSNSLQNNAKSSNAGNKNTIAWIRRLKSHSRSSSSSERINSDDVSAQLEKVVIQLQVLHRAILGQKKNRGAQDEIILEIRRALLSGLDFFPSTLQISGNIFAMKSWCDIWNSPTFNALVQYLSRDIVLKEEGIFRLSGSKKVQRDWKEAITSGQSKQLVEPDVHAIASLFKEWLREIPNPILGGGDYQHWIEVGKRIPEERMEYIAKLLTYVGPIERRLCLNSILRLMVDVSHNSPFNQMTSKNLGIVFGINAIRQTGESGSIVDGKTTALLWEDLIDNYYIYEPILSSSFFTDAPFELPKPQLPTFHVSHKVPPTIPPKSKVPPPLPKK